MDDQLLSLNLTEHDGHLNVPAVAISEEELYSQVGSPPVVQPKPNAANLNLFPKGAIEPTKPIKVYPINPDVINTEVLATYFESLSKSGGGPVAMIELVENYALIQFQNKQDELRVLNRPQHVIRKGAIFVEPHVMFVASGNIAPNEKTRTLVVIDTGILDEHLLEAWLESAENGGGPVEKMDLDEQKTIAEVIFESHKHASNFIRQKSAVICGQPVKFAEPTQKQRPEENEPMRTVIVSGLRGAISVEMLSTFFASEKKSGGGYIEYVFLNSHRDRAVIRYKDPKVAKRVLDKKELTLMRKQLKVDEPVTASEENTTLESSSTITVVGIQENMNRDLLKLFFENKKQSGGGPIKEIKVKKEWGTALITYKSPADAEMAASRKKHTLLGHELLVDLTANINSSSVAAIESASDNRSNSLLEVTNVPVGTCDQMLVLMFENSQHGGGAVEEVIQKAERGTAIVRFERQECIENVMNIYRKKKSMFRINATQLKLNVVDESDTIQVKNSCAIQVQGTPDNCTDDAILLYFENRRVCGGGPVEEIYKLQDSLVITFQNPEVASRVYQMHCNTSLKMENTLLKVKLINNRHRFKIFGDDTQSNTLFIEGLPEGTNRESLVSYLEKVPESKIHDIWFGLQAGMALVLFSKMPEWSHFFTLCCLKPYRGHMLGVSLVEKPKSIEVYNIKNCTQQILEMYFEHKRSRGGEIENIDVDRNKDHAIITFKNNGVADAVAGMTHCLNNDELTVNLHYPCLGILPKGHDKSIPKKPTPDDILCHPVDKNIVWFLAQGGRRDSIDQHLSTVYAKIDWPENVRDITDRVSLTCTMPLTITGTEKAEEWPKNAQNEFWSIYKQYGKETVNIQQDGWTEFSTLIAPLICNEHSIEVTLDTDLCSVVIVGKCNDVEERCRQISQIKCTVEDAISRKKESITEEIKNLPPFKLRLVQNSNGLQEIKTMFPNAKVDCDLKLGKITMKGLADEVQGIKLRMLEMLNQISSETVIFSPSICELLKHEISRDYIVKQLESRQIFMMFEVISRDQVLCYSRTDGDLTSGKAILTGAVQEMVMVIPVENQPTIKTNEWRRFVDKLKSDNDGQLILNVDSDIRSITVVCVDNISAGVREDIHRHLDENTVRECTIPMDKGQVKYLVQNKNGAIQQLRRQHHVEILANDTEQGLQLRGTKQSLQVCEKHLLEFAENIVQCRHEVDKPGMPKYYISSRGKDYIESLELIYKATILIDHEDPAVSSASCLQTTVSSVSFKNPIINSSWTLPNGTKVMVVKGDLTEHKVDVIVNAANQELKHKCGIAKSIVDKGGKAIQKECSKFIESQGRLAPGNIFVSDSGHLRCKQIVHAVVPQWQGGLQDEENTIYSAVYKSLEAVSKATKRTVGIPAIGAGKFGVPVEVACMNIIEAVSDFFKGDNHGIREVHLVDHNPTVVDTFRDTLFRHFAKDNIQLDSPQATGAASDATSGVNAVSRYWRKEGNNTLKSQEGISVTTVEGQLANNTAEVIVNTTSKDLNLANGRVSASILKAAGHSIQIECQQYIKSHKVITHGDIVETSGGRIQTCKNIYHGSLQEWSKIKNDSVIRKFVQDCLCRAHTSGMVSIAMPALGTGTLKYPREVIASAMYDEVKIFSNSHPSTKLKDIRFVVIDMETVTSFAAEKKKQEQDMCLRPIGATGTKRKLAKHGMKSTPSQKDVVLLSGAMDQYGAQLLIQNRVRIQVVKGDITTETCDAIVNGTDDELSMGTGGSQVSKAILLKGGQVIQEECKNIGKNVVDGVAITYAGLLPCKKIIHAEMPNDNRDVWGKRIKSALKLASQHNLSSVAFPALGTGMHRSDPTTMADMMVQNILEFCRKESSSSVELIKIVIFQEDMVGVYQQRLQMCAKSGKGLRQRLQNIFQGRSVDDSEVFETDALRAFVHPRRLSFSIYADSQSTVTEITKRIDATCNNEYKEQVLDSERDQELIKNLTEAQIETIMRFETSHGVTISVERIGRINRIVVRGGIEDTLKVVTEINRLFREIELAEGLHAHVRWTFDEGNGHEAYPPAINALIEGAYKRNEEFVEFTDETETTEFKRCTICFRLNIEIRDGATKQSYPVKRSSYELPKDWNSMDKGEVYKAVCLRDVSPEYQKVEMKFRSSMASKEHIFNSIISITRIQNPNLYLRYRVHLEHMEKRNHPQVKNELELWHGTADSALEEIHVTGFNRGFCGKNGTLYGRGVYFAASASFSNRYASPNSSGHKHMYLCRVLVGETTKGNPDFIVPPPKNPAQPAIKYDSVVDNETDPKIYVIFFDPQAYPEYLIKYT